IAERLHPCRVEVLHHEPVDALAVPEEVLAEASGFAHAELLRAVEEGGLVGCRDQVQRRALLLLDRPRHDQPQRFQLPPVGATAEEGIDEELEPAAADAGPCDLRQPDHTLVALAANAEILLAL